MSSRAGASWSILRDALLRNAPQDEGCETVRQAAKGEPPCAPSSSMPRRICASRRRRRPRSGPLDVRVRIEAGGICGSDLHYYLHGGFGTIRVREPMILGHEIAGTVEAVGGEVSAREVRRPGRGQSEPRLRPLPLLRHGPAAALHRHAVLRPRDALPPCPGRLPRHARCRGAAGGEGGRRMSRRRRRPSPSRSRSACMRPSAPARCSASACWSPARGRSACSPWSRPRPRARPRSSRPTWSTLRCRRR